jgi:NDP-sugar pyrophosphorylase family protein
MLKSPCDPQAIEGTAVWVCAAGYGERLRPYTYVRAKACLPTASPGQPGQKIWQNIVNHFAFDLKPNAFVLTTYYRPDDFGDARAYGEMIGIPVVTFQTEVLHNTACDFDLLRIFFPGIKTWYLCLGDMVLSGEDLIFFRDHFNAIAVGKWFKDSGTLFLNHGCQWFREKPKEKFDAEFKYRWRGILKMTPEVFRKPLPEPFLCTKSDRHSLHGKSFQETFMEAIVGNYQYFEPLHFGEKSIIDVGERGKYEQFFGGTERAILERIRSDRGSGSKASSRKRY